LKRASKGGITPGLGLIKGKVTPLKVDASVPHMGWNDVSTGKSKIFLVFRMVHVLFCS